MAFIAKIKNKELDFGSEYNSARWHDFKARNEGVELHIDKKKKSVSRELRGYYYGAIIPTCKETIPEWKTMKDEDVHEILKKLHNYFAFWNPITKRTERVGRSAMSESDSSTVRAMQFIEKIRVWLAEEYQVELPAPDEWKKNVRDGEAKFINEK